MNKIAVIPARSGSKRLPKKNYKPFNSRTLVEIARDKCLASGIFDKVIISSDDPVFEELVNCKEVEFLLRNENLASDNATTDMVVDFFLISTQITLLKRPRILDLFKDTFTVVWVGKGKLTSSIEVKGLRDCFLAIWDLLRQAYLRVC